MWFLARCSMLWRCRILIAYCYRIAIRIIWTSPILLSDDIGFNCPLNCSCQTGNWTNLDLDLVVFSRWLDAGSLRLLSLQSVWLRQGRHRAALHCRIWIFYAVRDDRWIFGWQTVKLLSSIIFPFFSLINYSSSLWITSGNASIGCSGRKRACITYCITYILSCITKHSPQYKVLLLGRILGGIATSLLFSAFESWLVAEHNKVRMTNY